MSIQGRSRLAHGLGWFSIGLGLVEIVAPGRTARWIGVPKSRSLLRFFGMREIATGMILLLHHKPGEAAWLRVAGDAADLSFLGAAHLSRSTDKYRLGIATATVGAVSALDVTSALVLSRRDRGRIVRTHTITINRPVEDVYRFWRNFENFPRFMSHVESIRITGEKRSHWTVRAPAGRTVEWEAEITEDQENERIAWRSLKGADIDNSGQVEFFPAPGGRGTEVRVRIEYYPPGGALGAALASLFGEEPGTQLKGDLYRLKQVMETGEVVHSDASIHRGLHPASPAPEPFWNPQSRYTH